MDRPLAGQEARPGVEKCRGGAPRGERAWVQVRAAPRSKRGGWMRLAAFRPPQLSRRHSAARAENPFVKMDGCDDERESDAERPVAEARAL
jgi:hypothetical protein